MRPKSSNAKKPAEQMVKGLGVRRGVGLHHPTTDLRSTSIIAGRVFWNESLVSRASV